MIAIPTLLAPLSRPDVAEVCLSTGKRPALRLAGGRLVEMTDGERLSGDDVLRVLFGTGGSRHVESLASKPAQWRTRIEGVGMVGVSASQKGDAIEARFVLRDTLPGSSLGLRPSNPAVLAIEPETAFPPRSLLGKPAPAAPLAVPPGAGVPSASPAMLAPRSVRPRTSADGVPSSRRGKAARAGLRSQRIPSPPPTRPAHDEGDRQSSLPTPPRGIPIPREAMPSLLEIDVDMDLPPVLGGAPAPLPPQGGSRGGGKAPGHDGGSAPKPPAIPPTLAPPKPSYAGHDRGHDGGPARKPSQPNRPAVAAQRAPSLRALEIHAPEEVAPPAIRRSAEEVVLSRTPLRTLPSVAQQDLAALAATAPEVVARIEPRRMSNVGRITRPFERDAQTPLFRKLLRTARELGGSDLHIVAGRAPLVRRGGQMVRVSAQTGDSGEMLDPELVENMIMARVPRRLEEALAQEGSCDFAVDEPDVGRFRVNVVRQRTGIKASLRLIPLSIPSPQALGIPDALVTAARQGRGLVVVAGPTGHGKTTTVASVVDLLNTELARHVITVEDPIEMVYPQRLGIVSQREVGTHARGLAAALRAALRQDPDVLVVGELRDAETARVALAASESGRLVLATMSASGAARAIDRVLDLFPPAEQPEARAALAGALRLVVGQRLVPDADARTLFAAFEVLPGGGPLASLIRDNRTYQIPALQQRGRDLGVLRLDESLRELVRTGRISVARALAAAESPEELETALGIRRPSQTLAAVAPHTLSPYPGSPYPGSPPAGPPQPRHTPFSSPRPEVKPPPEPKGIFDFFKKGGS